jgi:hypothetical protein
VPTSASERLFRRVHPTWVRDSGHVQIFPRRRLLQLLRAAGFEIQRTEKHNFEWTWFWIVHSVLRSRFDCTGTPGEHVRVSGWLLRGWRLLDRLWIGHGIRWCGNRLLPKSLYVYARKAPHG